MRCWSDVQFPEAVAVARRIAGSRGSSLCTPSWCRCTIDRLVRPCATLHAAHEHTKRWSGCIKAAGHRSLHCTHLSCQPRARDVYVPGTTHCCSDANTHAMMTLRKRNLTAVTAAVAASSMLSVTAQDRALPNSLADPTVPRLCLSHPCAPAPSPLIRHLV